MWHSNRLGLNSTIKSKYIAKAAVPKCSNSIFSIAISVVIFSNLQEFPYLDRFVTNIVKFFICISKQFRL